MLNWKRCFGKRELKPLYSLIRQRRDIEQRGCFSDQELDQKYCELAAIDRRIKAMEHSKFRQHIQSAYPRKRATIMQRWQMQ